MAREPYSCEHVVPIDEEPRHRLVIANQYVRAFAVEIAPQDRTLCHHHPHDYLLYVASDAEIVSAARDEAPKHLKYRDGECELSAAGLTHVVENVGDNRFRNAVVELLPGIEKLRRGSCPKIIAGGAHVETLLNEANGSVVNIAMKSGAEVEIAGPAVLAAPYEPVMMKEVEEFDIPLDDFRKLVWVCAPRTIQVRNSSERPGRLVIFQIGKSG